MRFKLIKIVNVNHIFGQTKAGTSTIISDIKHFATNCLLLTNILCVGIMSIS